MSRNTATTLTPVPAKPVPTEADDLALLRADLVPTGTTRPKQTFFEVFIPRERLLHATREQEREMKSFAWALAQHGWTIQFDQDVMRDGWWIRGWYGPRPLPERASGHRTERRFREAR